MKLKLQRRTSLLTIPPTERGPLLAAIVKALETLDAESRNRAVQREIAVSLAAQLDARAREAEKAEGARDKARKPFEAETKRAQEYARRVAETSKLFERVVQLFRTDAILTRLAVCAYHHVPPQRGSAIAYERNIVVAPALAREEILRSARLPGVWSGSDTSISHLVQRHWRIVDEDGGSDARIVGPIRELNRNADARRIILSNEQVDEVLARAQALLVSEYAKACRAIREVLALDAQLTAADRDARYPDGAPIFDPKMLPENWHVTLMSRRVVLPSIDGRILVAAE